MGINASKTCTKCKLTKSLEDFSRDSSTKDLIRRHCRECNAESARLKHVRYISKGNCTQCRRPHEGEGICCPDCLAKAQRRYLDRDPNACLECRKSDLITSLLCEFCWLKEVSRRFLKTRSKGSELKDLMVQQGYRCALSGVPIRFGLNASIDHILPKSLGGQDTLDNYRWVHTRVNQLRGNLTDAELYDLCYRVVNSLGPKVEPTGRETTWTETYKNGIY